MLLKLVKVKWLSFLCTYLSTTAEDIREVGGTVLLHILNLRTIVVQVFNCMAQQWK
jgi:hypothetical protein